MKLLAIILAVVTAVIVLGNYSYMKNYIKEHADDVVEQHDKKLMFKVNVITIVLVIEFAAVIIFAVLN